MQALKKLLPETDSYAATLEHLRKVSLFADIAGDASALDHLAGTVALRRYKPGEEIVREGEPGAEMFILIEGSASVFKHTSEGELYRVTILHGNEHSFFGEGALLDADSRSATIRAESDTVCLVLDRGSFEAFGRKYPEHAFPVLVRIARAVMARLRKTNHDLTLLYNALVAEIRGQ